MNRVIAGFGAAMTAWSVVVAIEASRQAVGRRRVVSRLGGHATRRRGFSPSQRRAGRGLVGVPAASGVPVVSGGSGGSVVRNVRGGARRRRRERDVLVDLLDDLAVTVAGGATLGSALVDVGASPAAHRSTRSLGADLVGGVPIDRALQRWCRFFTVVEARSVATVLAALVDGGADAARPIERMNEVVRQQAELEDEIRSAASPAVASAVTLSALPVLGVAAIAAIEPATARWLLATPAGLALVSGSAVWNTLGWLWMLHTTASVSS